MRLSVWTYPWDIADEGVDVALGRIAALGFDAIDLAANYHAISTLAPHAPRRKVQYMEWGAVFIPARLQRYGRVLPDLWPEAEVLRVWPAVAERLGRYRLTLNSWTIGMFQPWLARKYPECARVLPFGTPIWAGACPGNPLVQDYLARLASDIAEQFPVRQITLEGIGFPAFEYGWVRERIGIALGPWTRFLLGLCFCDACKARVRQRGVDADSLQRRVADELQAVFDAPGDEPEPVDVAARLAERAATDSTLVAYVRAREDAVYAIVEGIATAVAGRSRIVLEPSPGDPPAQGLDLPRVAHLVDGAYVPDPHATPEGATWVRQALATGGPGKELCANINASWPARPATAAFREQVAAARRFGVDQISFYNYGLIKLPQWRDVVAAART